MQLSSRIVVFIFLIMRPGGISNMIVFPLIRVRKTRATDLDAEGTAIAATLRKCTKKLGALRHMRRGNYAG